MKKEPEDIFKGLDAAVDVTADAAIPVFESAPRKSPLKLIGFGLAGLLVLGAVGFAAWYFLAKPNSPTEEAVGVAPAVEETSTGQVVEKPPTAEQMPVTTPPVGSNIPAPEMAPTAPQATSGQSGEGQPAVQPENAPVASNNVQPTEGADADQDLLTDAEEALLGTDPANNDTNANTYQDATEVGNLYDPVRKGASLASSPALKYFEWDGLKFLAPARWQLMVDALKSDLAVLDTGTSAKFMLQKRGDLGGQTLRGWLALSENDTSMRQLKTKGGWEALQTADRLTTYLAVNGTIYILSYELNGAPTYDFRTLFTLLANSLQVTK